MVLNITFTGVKETVSGIMDSLFSCLDSHMVYNTVHAPKKME